MSLKINFYKTILCLLLLLTTLAAVAQPPEKFYCRYGGNGYDVGYDVKQTLDNGYIITGSTSSFGQGNTDMYLLKLDSMGQRKFETSFGGYSNEVGKSIVQLSDSSFVMVGYTSSTGVGGYDIFLVKADKSGNLVWQKTIGGADWDFAYSLQATTDGGFIIAGTTYSFGHGNSDGYIVKTDANGDTTWTKTYGGKKDDEFKSVIQTADGNYALTGYTKSYNDSLGDAWIFRVDVNGDSLLCKFYGGNKEDFGNEIIEHPISGEYYIVGGTESYGVNLNYMNSYSLRLDNSGNYIHQTIDNTSSSYAQFNSIVISSRSPNIVNTVSKETVSGFGLQSKILEMDFTLNYINATDFGSTSNDELYKIIATKDKGYACIGFSQGYGAILSDCYFVKLDSLLNGGNYSIVSVNEISDNSFIETTVYPNPVKNELNLISNLPLHKSNIKLFDYVGNEISFSDRIIFISDNKITINIENLSAGFYNLIIGNKTEKIIVVN